MSRPRCCRELTEAATAVAGLSEYAMPGPVHDGGPGVYLFSAHYPAGQDSYPLTRTWLVDVYFQGGDDGIVVVDGFGQPQYGMDMVMDASTQLDSGAHWLWLDTVTALRNKGLL